MDRFDILVVGAGLAGASFAAALRLASLRIGLIDTRLPAAPREHWDTRIYAVSPKNTRFLATVGLWDHLAQDRLTAVHAMEIAGDRDGRLNFSAFDAGADQLAWIAEGGAMQWELWQNLRRQPNLTLLCPAAPARLHIDADQARLELADGRQLAAALVVGADGVESWVRAQAGIDARSGAYGELGVVANLRALRPHRNTAFQWFRDDGVLAWLPLGEHDLSVVWSAPEAFAQSLCALDASAFCARVEAAGKGRLGPMQALSGPLGFPLRIMRAARMVAQRVALIGDAAHAIHPLSGHGINLGFQDAQALAKEIVGASPRADIGELGLLRRFERARAEEIATLQALTHGLHQMFAAQSPPIAWLRNFGMNLTDRATVVRNALARYAMG